MKKAFIFFLPAVFAMSASASTIYQEVFATGAALTSDPLVNSAAISSYFLSTSSGNGYVVTNSGTDPQTPSAAGAVTAQPAGVASPYFLVEGTGTPNTSGNTVFFSSSTISGLSQNTNYSVSFQMTNPNNAYYPSIALLLNGTTLFSGVYANGYYNDGNAADGWQTFTATWNSGSSTTAVISLSDANTTTTSGNDFAVDNIQLSTIAATPEPSTFALLGAGALVAGVLRRKKKV